MTVTKSPRYFLGMGPWTVAIWLIVLQVLDAITTLVGVHTLGGIEANPILANVVHNIPWLFVLLKVALCGVLATFVPWSVRRSYKMSRIWGALAMFYVVVVTNNITQIGISLAYATTP